MIHSISIAVSAGRFSPLFPEPPAEQNPYEELWDRGVETGFVEIEGEQRMPATPYSSPAFAPAIAAAGIQPEMLDLREEQPGSPEVEGAQPAAPQNLIQRIFGCFYQAFPRFRQ